MPRAAIAADANQYSPPLHEVVLKRGGEFANVVPEFDPVPRHLAAEVLRKFRGLLRHRRQGIDKLVPNSRFIL